MGPDPWVCCAQEPRELGLQQHKVVSQIAGLAQSLQSSASTVTVRFVRGAAFGSM